MLAQRASSSSWLAWMGSNFHARPLVKFGHDASLHKEHFFPYVQSICAKEGLDFMKQHSMLLIDCYLVHRFATFLEWMREKHPLIHVLFIPGNYTSSLQPCDVVL